MVNRFLREGRLLDRFAWLSYSRKPMKRVLNQLLATIQLALRRTWTALGSHAAVALGV